MTATAQARRERGTRGFVLRLVPWILCAGLLGAWGGFYYVVSTDCNTGQRYGSRQRIGFFSPGQRKALSAAGFLLLGKWHLLRHKPFEAERALQQGLKTTCNRQMPFLRGLVRAYRDLGAPQKAAAYEAFLAGGELNPERTQASRVAEGRIRFVEVAKERGLDFVHGARHPFWNMGPGACAADVDGDGWEDLFLQQGETGASQLFLNQKGRFVASDAWGVRQRGSGMGCLLTDLDNDGLPDLILSNYGPNQVFRNTGKGFVEVRGAAPGEPSDFSTCLTAADVDGNGLLDLYVGNYVDVSDVPPPAEEGLAEDSHSPLCCPARRDRFYLNRGGFKFEEATDRYFPDMRAHPTLGCVFADVDGDGRLDLITADDAYPNRLYLQQKDGTFGDAADRLLVHDGRSGMGLALADFNADGRLDFFITHIARELHALYVSRSGTREPLYYADDALAWGIRPAVLSYVGFGTGFFDMDNDGLQDLFIANGHIHPRYGHRWEMIPQPDQLFLQTEPGRFQEAGEAAGPYFDLLGVGRAAVFLDYDRDGDVDILVTNNLGRPYLAENRTEPAGNWLQLRLIAAAGPRDAVGARVSVRAGGQVLTRRITLGESYLAGNSLWQHVGLGDADRADEIMVAWPSGHVETLRDIPANRRLVVRERSAPLP